MVDIFRTRALNHNAPAIAFSISHISPHLFFSRLLLTFDPHLHSSPSFLLLLSSFFKQSYLLLIYSPLINNLTSSHYLPAWLRRSSNSFRVTRIQPLTGMLFSFPSPRGCLKSTLPSSNFGYLTSGPIVTYPGSSGVRSRKL